MSSRDTDSDNPRIQCEHCGKWYRLYDRDDNQILFPLYTSDGDYEWLQEDIEYNSLCVWCHLLFGVVCQPFKTINPERTEE